MLRLGLRQCLPTVTLDDPPQKVADVLAENLQTARVKVYSTQKMERQVNMLTSGSFGGDTNALEQSKIYYRGQIEKLMENQQGLTTMQTSLLQSLEVHGGKPGGELITVQPTYGGYFQSYVVYPVIGLMALGGVLAVMKMAQVVKSKPNQSV